MSKDGITVIEKCSERSVMERLSRISDCGEKRELILL